MKRSFSKRAWSAFLALAIIVTAVFGNVTTAKAATTDYVTIHASSTVEYATAGVEIKIPFTVTANQGIDVLLYVYSPVQTTLSLYNGAGSLVTEWDNNPLTISANNYSYDPEYGYFFHDSWEGSLPAGDYYYGITFTEDQAYLVDIAQMVSQAKISQTKATVTKGFTKKLSVENGKVKKWSSSKTSVAKVDSKGKVTAKKAGKATITATLEDGSKLKCTVTVKENKYSDSKLTTSDVYRGDCAMSAYSASFDKSGNLVIKTRFVNNNYYKVSSLNNIKIVVKDGNGKTVGTYKLSKKNVSIPVGSTKDFSFTIKKSSLKKKTVDLRNCTITCDGSYGYYY